MPQSTPTPAVEPPPKRARPPAETPPPVPDAPAPKPPEEGAIFRALHDAGADAVVPYTAEKRLHTMISDAIAPQLQPLLTEVFQRFDQIDRRLDQIDRRLGKIDGRLDAHDRKLDVLAAQMRLLVGAMGLLVTVLIAVFGFLFANTN